MTQIWNLQRQIIYTIDRNILQTQNSQHEIPMHNKVKEKHGTLVIHVSMCWNIIEVLTTVYIDICTESKGTMASRFPKWTKGKKEGYGRWLFHKKNIPIFEIKAGLICWERKTTTNSFLTRGKVQKLCFLGRKIRKTLYEGQLTVLPMKRGRMW